MPHSLRTVVPKRLRTDAIFDSASGSIHRNLLAYSEAWMVADHLLVNSDRYHRCARCVRMQLISSRMFIIAICLSQNVFGLSACLWKNGGSSCSDITTCNKRRQPCASRQAKLNHPCQHLHKPYTGHVLQSALVEVARTEFTCVCFYVVRVRRVHACVHLQMY